MNKEDINIIRFCSALAQTREQFRSAHINVEKKDYLKQVTTTVSHAQSDFNEALLKGQPHTDINLVRGVEISYSLDAELLEIIEEEKYSLGASISIRSLKDHWLLQGEIGWSCINSGWDEYDSFEKEVTSADDVINELPVFCNRVLSAYQKFVEEQKQPGRVGFARQDNRRNVQQH